MKTKILLYILVFSISGCSSLLTRDDLKKEKEYRSLDRALVNPEKVYRLSLWLPGKTVPESILKLQNLKELTLSGKYVTALPDFIFSLPNLQVLKVHCSLFQLNQLVGKLEKLKELNLDLNKLNSLPGSILKLQKLEILNLSHNSFTRLPDFIGRLENLKKLLVTNNMLKTIPETTGNLNELEFLILSENLLEKLPDSIGKLESLENLFLGSNRLSQLPDSIKNLNKLELLSIEKNRFSRFPGQLAAIKSLKSIYIDNNMVQEIPGSIGKLENLEVLSAKHNRIHTVHKSIGSLGKLKKLGLDNNRLFELPETIMNLNKLQLLDIKSNLLTPEEVKKIKSMRRSTYIYAKGQKSIASWTMHGRKSPLRNQPSSKGKVSEMIPGNMKLIKLHESGPVVKISGISGKWTKVQWNGKRGWIFGGFLSRRPFVNPKYFKGVPLTWIGLSNKGVQSSSGFSIVKPCSHKIPSIKIFIKKGYPYMRYREKGNREIMDILKISRKGRTVTFTCFYNSGEIEIKYTPHSGQIMIWKGFPHHSKYQSSYYLDYSKRKELPFVYEKCK